MDNATVAVPPLPSHPVFQGASFVILTDNAPRFSVQIQAPLAEYLALAGFSFEPVRGCYDGHVEDSFIVYTENWGWLTELASDYGQESIITSRDGHNRLLFTNGPKAGSYHAGRGFTVFAEQPQDYFSTLSTPTGPVHFSLALNFDVLESAQAQAA